MRQNRFTLTDDFENAERSRYLAFVIGEENFALEVASVTEIVGMYPVTRLPDLPPYIKGVVNLRGKIVPLVDVRLKFGKPAIPYGERTAVVVVEKNGISAGLIVDGVAEVLSIPDEEIVSPPELGASAQSSYINGVAAMGERVALLIDIEKLLCEDEAAGA